MKNATLSKLYQKHTPRFVICTQQIEACFFSKRQTPFNKALTTATTKSPQKTTQNLRSQPATYDL
jgi:hypothetical protein